MKKSLALLSVTGDVRTNEAPYSLPPQRYLRKVPSGTRHNIIEQFGYFISKLTMEVVVDSPAWKPKRAVVTRVGDGCGRLRTTNLPTL